MDGQDFGKARGVVSELEFRAHVCRGKIRREEMKIHKTAVRYEELWKVKIA